MEEEMEEVPYNEELIPYETEKEIHYDENVCCL